MASLCGEMMTTRLAAGAVRAQQTLATTASGRNNWSNSRRNGGRGNQRRPDWIMTSKLREAPADFNCQSPRTREPALPGGKSRQGSSDCFRHSPLRPLRPLREDPEWNLTRSQQASELEDSSPDISCAPQRVLLAVPAPGGRGTVCAKGGRATKTSSRRPVPPADRGRGRRSAASLPQVECEISRLVAVPATGDQNQVQQREQGLDHGRHISERRCAQNDADRLLFAVVNQAQSKELLFGTAAGV